MIPWVSCYELVASFVNLSNLLNSWGKNDIRPVRRLGACGQKNTAITCLLAHALPRSRMHFSDRTALVCSCCPPPGRMREASARRKTRNQLNIKENPRNRKTPKLGSKRRIKQAINAVL